MQLINNKNTSTHVSCVCVQAIGSVTSIAPWIRCVTRCAARSSGARLRVCSRAPAVARSPPTWRRRAVHSSSSTGCAPRTNACTPRCARLQPLIRRINSRSCYPKNTGRLQIRLWPSPVYNLEDSKICNSKYNLQAYSITVYSVYLNPKIRGKWNPRVITIITFINCYKIFSKF